jgi:hypothetical protein
MSKKPTDQALKDYAFSFRTNDLVKLKCKNKDCPNNGECLGDSSVNDIVRAKESFWGNDNDPAPTSKQRQDKCMELLRDAYSKASNNFHFKVGKRVVCETGYLMIHGLSINNYASQANRKWKRCKFAVEKGLRDGCIRTIEKLTGKKLSYNKNNKLGTDEYRGRANSVMQLLLSSTCQI